jgi:5-formyltetrahydrofolate cyclo-ligase
MSNCVMPNKIKTRKHIKTLLTQLNATKRDSATKLIFQYIKPLLDNNQHIAVYYANKYEVDLKQIIEYCLLNHKAVYKPVAYKTTRNMLLEPIKDITSAPGNIFSNDNYVPECVKSWYNIDLIILPIVAVDSLGYRLGQGGGYYDYTLANLPKTTILCGVGYDFQQLSFSLPHEAHDIQLDYYVSDNGRLQYCK